MTTTFMGNPCKRGHDGRRYNSNGHCVTCNVESAVVRNAKPEVKKRNAENAAAFRKTERYRGYIAEYLVRPGYKQRQAINAAKWYAAGGKTQRAAYHDEHKNRPGVKQYRAAIRRLRMYDLTPTEHSFMFAGQLFRCEICGTDEPNGVGWHTDHCHETNEVRGILCHSCNTGIGHLGDNAAGVRRALAYLERFECQTTQQTNSPTATDETAGQSHRWPNTAQVATQYIPLSAGT